MERTSCRRAPLAPVPPKPLRLPSPTKHYHGEHSEVGHTDTHADSRAKETHRHKSTTCLLLMLRFVIGAAHRENEGERIKSREIELEAEERMQRQKLGRSELFRPEERTFENPRGQIFTVYVLNLY